MRVSERNKHRAKRGKGNFGLFEATVLGRKQPGSSKDEERRLGTLC